MKKFIDHKRTVDGEPRAHVPMYGLKTLWFNTGTLCNLTCANCYIESSPTNDALVYLSLSEVCRYLDEIEREEYPVEEIGITGGEPFMNPDILLIMKECLKRGYRLLTLTNAMRPMEKCADGLLELQEQYGDQMVMRVSVDHFKQEMHEEERGLRSWAPMIKGLKWLSDHKFNIDVAGRTRWGEGESELRDGFAELFAEHGVEIDAHSEKELVLFPEMDEAVEVPEITTACWKTLGVLPADMMCSSSRMIVKHKGAAHPSVMACTLLAYDPRFNMGASLKEAQKPISLNHHHCAKFCVLGGGACSA